MAERGIIFCTEMVKAILDDRKTKTRRIEGLKELNEDPVGSAGWTFLGWGENGCAEFYDKHGFLYSIKPRCQVGDFLWVKETWAMRTDTKANTPKAKHYLRYKADDTDLEMEWHNYERWRSSRFMPKWAARIWLQVTGLKVEQLQDISEEDCIAEGVGSEEYCWSDLANSFIPKITAYEKFEKLWDSLHKKPGERWADNRWVLVYDFKRIEKGA